MDKGTGWFVGGIIAVSIIILVIIGFSSKSTNQPIAASSSDDTVVSKSGIHWHPKLSIFINGQQQPIPANIGIGAQYSNNPFYDSMMSMTDIHTHDASGTLHWEVMDGPVKVDHVRLKAFFEIWGQPFNDHQLLSANHGTVTMTVNGQPNSDLGQYIVRDGDNIVITFMKNS